MQLNCSWEGQWHMSLIRPDLLTMDKSLLEPSTSTMPMRNANCRSITMQWYCRHLNSPCHRVCSLLRYYSSFGQLFVSADMIDESRVKDALFLPMSCSSHLISTKYLALCAVVCLGFPSIGRVVTKLTVK